MSNDYKEKFKVVTAGMHKLVYEDSSCRIELPADDVRDISIGVSIGSIICKNGCNIDKLTDKQKREVYNRVSAVLRLEGHSGIFTYQFKLIEEDMESLDISKDILDIDG